MEALHGGTHFAASFGSFERGVGIVRGSRLPQRGRGARNIAVFAPLAPPPSPDSVEGKVRPGAPQPCGGVRGARRMPCMKLQERFLRDVFGLVCVKAHACRDGANARVFLEEQGFEGIRCPANLC